MEQENKLYTLTEVAEILRMKWSWVDRKVRSGKIKHVQMGGTRLINNTEIQRIIAEGVK